MSANIISHEHAVYNAKIGKGWHGLGIEISGDGDVHAQIEEAKKAAPLLVSEHVKVDLQVMTSDPALAKVGPRYDVSRNGSSKAVAIQKHPRMAAVVRVLDGKILPGVVSQTTDDKEGFSIYQPSAMAEDAARVAAQCPGASLSFAAILGDNRVFWCFDLGDCRVNGEVHHRHLTLVTGLDGCQSREIMVHVIRAVCNNTVGIARSQAKSGSKESRDSSGRAYHKIRNTSGADRRTDRKLRDVAVMLEQFGILKRRLEVLPQVKVDEEEAKKAVEDSLAKAGRKRSAKSFPTLVDEILADYADPRADHARWHGTLNGVYQALTNRATNVDTVTGARSIQKGLLDKPGAADKLTLYRYEKGAEKTEAFMQVMDEISRSKGFEVDLADAGFEVGEDLADGEAKAYSLDDLL